MSPLSAARAALRVYAVGAALIVAQLLRRCVRGFVEPGQRPGRGAGRRRGAGAGRGCGVGLAGDRAAGPGARPPPVERTPGLGRSWEGARGGGRVGRSRKQGRAALAVGGGAASPPPRPLRAPRGPG